MTSLVQIVAALSVTYHDAGVVIWLDGVHRNGVRPLDLLSEGRNEEVAELVRRLGDADPDEFITFADGIIGDAS